MAVCRYYEWCSTRQNAFSDSKNRLEEKYCKNLGNSDNCQTNQFLTEELSRPDSFADFERKLSRMKSSEKDLSQIQ